MSARLPPWGELEVFLATSRKGTLAAAGEHLGVNASTVQRRLLKLETELGTRLFDRSKRGYALTSTGQALLEHVLGIEHEVLAIGRHISGRDQSLEGPIRIATVDDLAVSLLPPILRDFRRANPKVSIELGIGADFADLSRKQADVAVRISGRPSLGDLVVKHVAQVDVALYASRSYLRAHGRPRALSDLRHHDIVRGDASMSRLPMERLIDRHADPARIALRSNSLLTRLTAIREGIGIGLLGCFMGERERSLQRLELRFPEASSDLWLIVHVDLRRNARVRSFVDFVYPALRAQRLRFADPAG